MALLGLRKSYGIALQTLFVQLVTEICLPAGGEGTQTTTIQWKTRQSHTTGVGYIVFVLSLGKTFHRSQRKEIEPFTKYY